jgi:hypothetical protein
MQSINKIGAVALVSLVPGIAFGQAGQGRTERQSAFEGFATRESQPVARELSGGAEGNRQGEGSRSAAYSDTGLQRVVNKKENAFAVDAGASTGYMYRSNVLSTNGMLAKAVKSGVMEVNGFASASLGNYEFLGGVYTPRVGYNISQITHSKKVLSFADYLSNRVSFAGDLKFESGWSVTPALDYSNIVSSKFHTEDYNEWYPNLTVGKVWGIDDKTMVRASASTGYHFSTVDSLGGTVPGLTANRLDNWTNSVGLSLYRTLFYGIVWQGYGELSNRGFSNGQNVGRTDLMKTIGESLTYNWRFLRFSTYLNFSNRHSSDYTNDYKNLDAGASVSAVVNF